MADVAEKVKEFVDLPQSFLKEGTQFMTRCAKPTQKGQTDTFRTLLERLGVDGRVVIILEKIYFAGGAPSKYFEICRAVAIGFAVMGFLGYFVKLIHIPINNILVGGA